jgi:hypothetical protein
MGPFFEQLITGFDIAVLAYYWPLSLISYPLMLAFVGWAEE